MIISVSSLKETHLRPVLDPVSKIRLLPSLLLPPTYQLDFFVMKSRYGAFLIVYTMLVYLLENWAKNIYLILDLISQKSCPVMFGSS